MNYLNTLSIYSFLFIIDDIAIYALFEIIDDVGMCMSKFFSHTTSLDNDSRFEKFKLIVTD